MQSSIRNPRIEILIHLLGWCLLFGFPFIFLHDSHQPHFETERYIGFLVYTMSFFVVFYTNYLYLINKFLFERNTFTFIAINVALIALCTYLLHTYQHLEFSQMHLHRHHEPMKMPPPPNMFIFRDLSSMVFAAGLSVAIRMTGKWYKTENERKEMEKDRYETELKNLQNQLNPHFLFNTLNNIYSLIPVRPELAQDTVHRLSSLLRYVLYENNDNFVPLDKEISFIKSYIELMSLRLSDDVKITTTFNIPPNEATIAPLLFISLVENAFKHGISPTHESFVKIDIQATGNDILCTVENSYYPKKEEDKSGSGIGQENLRKRLGLIYPGKHELTLEVKENVYFARLHLSL